MTVAESIEEKLRARFRPVHLDVKNESGMHAVPKGSETHFRVVVVSSDFEGVGRVDRHKMIYDTLQDELRAGLHALAVVSRTPAEWEREANAGESPACMGGSAAEKRNA